MTDKRTPRESLLQLLADYVKPMNGMGEDRTHRKAEDLLLAVLADPEISKAWRKARKRWWYA